MATEEAEQDRSKSDEVLDYVSVPAGSEKVVQVKKRSKSSKSSLLMDINSMPLPASKYDFDAHSRKFMRRERRHRSKHESSTPHKYSLFNLKKKSESKDSKSQHPFHSEISIPPKMISTPDMRQATEQIKSEGITETDLRNEYSVNRRQSWAHPDEKKPLSFVKSKLRGSKERTDSRTLPEIRYSNIFSPGYQKHYRSHTRLPRSKSTSGIFVVPQLAQSRWNIGASYPLIYCPNCMANTCYRCRTTFLPQRSFSYDLPGIPPPNADIDDVYDNPIGPPGSMPQYRGSLDNFTRSAWKNQAHSFASLGYTMQPLYPSNRPYQPRSRTNLEDVDGYYENNLNKGVDLLEIEYTSFVDENTIQQLSLDNLQSIYALARKAITVSEQLEEMAEYLKLALDAELGEKWHAIVGVDSFGSNIESLPGALANLKIEKFVFLVWQT